MPSIIQPASTKRLLNMFVLVDHSGSMASDGKISALNCAMREFSHHLQEFVADYPQLDLRLQVYAFGGTVSRVFPQSVDAESYRWSDLSVYSDTPMGAAFSLVKEDLDSIPSNVPCYAPTIALLTDGQPTDRWETPMTEMFSSRWGRKASRAAVAIGSDCDRGMLSKFLGNSERKIIEAPDASQMLKSLVLATVVQSQAATCSQVRHQEAPVGGSQRSLFNEDIPTDSLTDSILSNTINENVQW